MADLSLLLEPVLAQQLVQAMDVEGKIPRAFEALATFAGSDVLLLDGDGGSDGGRYARAMRDLGGSVSVVADDDGSPAADLAGIDPGSADVLVSCWSSFRADLPDALVASDRVLRDGGRLLVLHDYGRDDVSRLRPSDLPEYTTWSRRDGWFLRTGFKVRVIHCWWTYDSVESASAFLAEAFGEPGTVLANTLKRPRLSYNVAIYHWTKGADTIAMS